MHEGILISDDDATDEEWIRKIYFKNKNSDHQRDDRSLDRIIFRSMYFDDDHRHVVVLLGVAGELLRITDHLADDLFRCPLLRIGD